MVLIQSKARRQILENLTRESRLSSPLLRQMEQELLGGEACDPSGFGRLYEGELSGNREGRRASGSYYTPDYLVDFVVEQTLAPMLRNIPLCNVFAFRILDPSCGAGAFLLGVLRFLEAHCQALGAIPDASLRARLSACLVGIDTDGRALSVCQAAIALAVAGSSGDDDGGKHQVASTLIEGDALCPSVSVGQVDAIVGNPPWGQKGFSLTPQKRSQYKKHYVCAKGNWDPFKLFVERCHHLLPGQGRWGLVLPDIVLLKNVQEVRDVILDGSDMDEIAHCGRVFEGANIDAVAIIASRKSPKSMPIATKRKTIRVWPELPRSWRTSKVNTHRQEQHIFSQLPGHIFNLYLHGDALALYQRLLPLQRLGHWYEMHEGVHTGNCRQKLFLSERRSTDCKKVIVGRKEFSAYSLQWGGKWLNTNSDAIDRERGEYANLGRSAWHGPDKIVVRRTGDRVLAAFDGYGYYVSNNLFVLKERNEGPANSTRVRAKAIVALLNSRFMTWYFRAVVPRKGRLFAELKLTHLRDFPLPSLDRWRDMEAPLAALSEIAGGDKGRKVADEVNAIVEKAFELSPRELEVIKLSL